MSSRFKRCKNCGTTNASDFAPRKSVICKNCEGGSTESKVFTEVKPSVNIPRASLHPSFEEVNENLSNTDNSEVVKSTIPSNSSELSEGLEEVSNDSSDKKASNISEETIQIIFQKFSEVEANYNLLKSEVEKLSRLKKMFPRMFPEDESK
jgi:hypothetical protein